MRTSLIALLGSVVYATARYNVFKGVPWSDWPTYTLNKALALSALVLIVVAVKRKLSPHADAHDRTVQIASMFGCAHVLLSVMLLAPAYYGKMFAQGKLTAAAGWSMLLGASAAAVMAAGKGRPTHGNADGGRRTLAVLALVIGVHAMLQGLAGWFVPSEWPGRLPPITLLSFLLGVAAVCMALSPRRAP